MNQPTATTTSEETAAPAPPVQAPPRPKRRGSFRKWWARFIVLLLLAAAVLLFLRISAIRADDAEHLKLGTVTLVAQAIPVETARPGQVTSVSVVAEQRVKIGQKLGTVQVTSIDSQGEPVLDTVTLVAPRAGIVVDEPVTLGSTLQPGQAFVRLYDPAKLTFICDAELTDLTIVAPGMVASLQAEGLDETVRAEVQRIVPRVGAAGDNPVEDPDKLRLVLVPAKGQDMTGLVPGLRFTGEVDLLTGTPGQPRLITAD